MVLFLSWSCHKSISVVCASVTYCLSRAGVHLLSPNPGLKLELIFSFLHVSMISMSHLTTMGIKDSLNSNFMWWNLCNLCLRCGWLFDGPGVKFSIKVFISKDAGLFWKPGHCQGGMLGITVKPPYVFPVGVVLIIENEQNKDPWWYHKKQTMELFHSHSTGKTSCGRLTSKRFLLWIHSVFFKNLPCS